MFITNAWECVLYLYPLLSLCFKSLQTAQEELESMATIAEQEKLKNLGLEKELQASKQSGPSADSGSTPERVRALQQALQEKERWFRKKLNY